MSECAINIRIWYWHWQVTFSNKWSWTVNEYIYETHRKALWKRPLTICAFRPWEIKFSNKVKDI